MKSRSRPTVVVSSTNNSELIRSLARPDPYSQTETESQRHSDSLFDYESLRLVLIGVGSCFSLRLTRKVRTQVDRDIDTDIDELILLTFVKV